MADGRDKDRHKRLSAALRENLKRRKQQLRGRADRGAPAGGEDEAAAPDHGEGDGGPAGDDRQ